MRVVLAGAVILYGERLRASRHRASGWSMDRRGIRTLFDRESGRLKQIELSGLRRERVSLGTYPDELTAREVEICQEAKYGKWCVRRRHQSRDRLCER